jgi:outer membrane protein assembly factor BamB
MINTKSPAASAGGDFNAVSSADFTQPCTGTAQPNPGRSYRHCDRIDFVGGTMDRRVRALSADTGKELWSAELPASAHATPITYAAGGKQIRCNRGRR